MEAKLMGLSRRAGNINGLLHGAINAQSRLDTLYEEGTIVQKRRIIGSMYPEKLTFDGFGYRTQRVNNAVSIIYSVDVDFRQKKPEKRCCFALFRPGISKGKII